MGIAGKKIYQFIPNLLEGDGIADNCLAIHRLLSENGCKSRIFAGSVHPEVTGLVSPIDCLDVPDLLLYHFGGPFDLLEEATALPCRRGMIYHNVTPAEFYEPYDPATAQMCRRGRERLPRLREFFDFALAVSAYNRLELVHHGFPRAWEMPLVIDWPQCAPESGQGKTKEEELRLLFVGRMVPNKKVEDLLEVLARLRKSRRGGVSLTVVGYDDPEGAYGRYLRRRAVELKVASLVDFAGRVARETLQDHYRRSTVFLTLSEHEGFCVPILESMYFRLPVVAFAAGAVPETVGDAGLLLDKKSPEQVAKAIELVADIPQLRRALTDRGARRVKIFNLERTGSRLLAVLEEEFKEAGNRKREAVT